MIKNIYFYTKKLENDQIFSTFIQHSVRGRLGSILMLAANMGFLFGFLAGYYLTYFTIPYIGIILSIIYLVSFAYFPETPSFLLRCKKPEVNYTFNFNANVNFNCICLPYFTFYGGNS